MDGVTPIDVAGDLEKWKCIRIMVEHFLKKEQKAMMNAFTDPWLF